MYTNTQSGTNTSTPYSSIASAHGMGLGGNLFLWPFRGPHFGVGLFFNYSHGSNFISGTNGKARDLLLGTRIIGGFKKYKLVFDLGKGSRSGHYYMDLDASLASSGYLSSATSVYVLGDCKYSLKKNGFGLMYEKHSSNQEKQIYYTLMRYSERPNYLINTVQNTWRFEMRNMFDLYLEISRRYPAAGNHRYNIENNKQKALFLIGLGIPISKRKEYYLL